MADKKNQHFVPRCLLKPFTLNGEDKAINLYAFEKDLLVQNAPVRKQCARDYIYGKNGVLEDSLANIEGLYGSARDRIVKQDDSEDDREIVRFFAYLQFRRTQMAIERLQKSEAAFFKDTFGDEAPAEPPFSYFMAHSLRLCIETSHLIEDLKVRVVQNNTDVDFVTSDDPAIMANKLHAQQNMVGGFGIGSSGVLLLMPISPRFAALCYDGLVYTIPNVVNGRIILSSRSDVEALNELHFLKAASTVYFSSWGTRDYVREQFQKVRANRMSDWFVIKYAVHARTDENGNDIFREATAEEAKVPGRSLVHTYFKYPVPSQWLSHLKYRSPIKTFGRGLTCGVRKEEWLQQGGMMR